MPRDILRYFRVEAKELLDGIGAGLLEIEGSDLPVGPVGHVLRLAHTLKGAARVVKQPRIADHAHLIEEILDPYREPSGRIPKELIDQALRLVDEMRADLAGLGREASPEAPAEPTGGTPDPVPADVATVRADISDMDRMLDGVAEATSQLATLNMGVRQVERALSLVDLLLQQLSSPREQARAAERARSTADEIRSLLASMDRSCSQGAEQLERELADLRERAESLRFVRADALFPQLEQAARDVAQTMGKKVRFETRGGEIRLDAHVLETVHAALRQAVRNAAVHGIETEPERLGAGKAPEGRVTLEVSRRDDHVAFVCRDDGKGVAVEAIREAARRKGLISAASQPGTDELLAMLFESGISTSESVSEMSGRGLGMDIVGKAVRSLGGKVSIRTAAGEGTALEMLVPIYFAALNVLTVEAQGMTVAIPLEHVRACLRVVPEDLARSGDGEMLIFDGAPVRFMPIGRLLSSTLHRSQRAWTAVIVGGKEGLAAFGVDRVLGASNVVVRPLPALAPALPVVAGAALRGDGSTTLVVSPDALVRESKALSGAPAPVERATPRVLVIDDSLTSRMLEQSILESAGYEVDTASSAEEGLDMAQRRAYSLFLVDVEMPGMDGFTFVERVCSSSNLRDVPAILVTSRHSAEDMKRGVEAGARAYFVKSEFDQRRLLETIQSLVRR